MRKFIIPLFAIAFLFSCNEDELMDDSNDDITQDEITDDETTDDDEIVAYESETFEDLTTADFDNIDTPFEEELASLTGARVMVDAEDLATVLADLFNATLISVEEGEARGLSVYKVKVLFEDGTVAKITVVQDIYEILAIEAIPSEDIQDEVSIDGFISLATAIETVTDLIDGQIVRWEISLEEDTVLEFEIHIIATDGSRYEIELDASTGELIAQKIFETEEDEVEFEEEAEEETSDDNSEIADAVANFITADILFASTGTDAAGSEAWNVLAETASGRIVNLVISASTKELISAEGTQGPFDYDITFLADGVSFANQLASVEGQMGIEVDSWTYHYVSTTAFSYWALTFYAEDEIGNQTTVVIDASSGEWIESSTTPFDAFMEQLAVYTSAEIQYAYRYDNDGNPFWDLTLVNEADAAGNPGATITALIYEAEYEILRAYPSDESSTINYDFNFGGDATISLSDGIAKAEDYLSEVDATSYYWNYENSVDVEEVSYHTLTISLADPNQTFYYIYIDVETGNIIKEESF